MVDRMDDLALNPEAREYVPASPVVGMHQPQHLTLPPPHQMVSVQHAPPGVSLAIPHHSPLHCRPSLIALLQRQAAGLTDPRWF